MMPYHSARSRDRARGPLALTAATLTTIAATILWLAPAPAYAQNQTTGAIQGVVLDSVGGTPLVGAEIIVRGPALQGQESTTSDFDGSYEILGLPPGFYQVEVRYSGSAVTRNNVLVRLGKTARANIRVQAGEVVEITGRAPLIDQGSTKTGITISEENIRGVPLGRTFADVLDLASGAQADEYGTSFGGATSPENSYLVDGLNVTGVGFGQLTLSLPLEFLSEIEIVSGGYDASLGRSTGGLINVLSKSGGNEFHGSVFGYFTPDAFNGTARLLPNESSAIVFRRSVGYQADFGAELGGPIIPDTLWFHVGASPSLANERADRVIGRFVDRDGDLLADRNTSGLVVYDRLDSRAIDIPTTVFYFTGKLTYAAADDHRGSLSVFGNPTENDLLFDDFAVGPDGTLLMEEERGAVAGQARWTSRFANGAGQLVATLDLYRGRANQAPKSTAVDDQAFRWTYALPLDTFTDFEDVPEACIDDVDGDEFANFTNCPVTNYQIGGIDFFQQKQESQRLGGSLTYQHRFSALGRHRIQVGADVEQNRYTSTATFSGGNRWWDFGFGIANFRFVQPEDGGDVACGQDFDGDGILDGECAADPGGRFADTETLNLGLFAQESWTVLPNLTLNAGVRYERQALGAAEEVVGEIDPFTGEPYTDRAFSLNNVSPRAGAIYDWTNQGRSRVFAHWGRYYESIPLDLNARGFSGETVDIRLYSPDSCSDPMDPSSYACMASGEFFGQQVGGGKLVSPNIRGQYMDEIIAGVEYEPLADLRMGLTYTRRDLGRAIEDVSADGNVFVLANPGEADSGAVADLRAQAEAAVSAGDMTEANRLGVIADAYESVGRFDSPRRVYDAVKLSLFKRFSRNFTARASYTYARLRGNFPGLFSPDTEQLDPNFTSMYDLPELLSNRNGDLPGDRPHQVKVDAFYELPVAKVGTFLFGARARGTSGRPHNYLGANLAYGADETFILPRGSADRGSANTAFDVQLAYGRELGASRRLELFVSAFNVFNQQSPTRLDETYTFDVVDPVVGGDTEDLKHVKGPDSNQVISKNPNFGNPVRVQAPIQVRLGARVSF